MVVEVGLSRWVLLMLVSSGFLVMHRVVLVVTLASLSLYCITELRAMRTELVVLILVATITLTLTVLPFILVVYSLEYGLMEILDLLQRLASKGR